MKYSRKIRGGVNFACTYCTVYKTLENGIRSSLMMIRSCRRNRAYDDITAAVKSDKALIIYYPGEGAEIFVVISYLS